ncbi:KAP family NTPase [Sphingopyxis indica]|nr:KAP family NTPase [Sphingopyxis indica]
MQADRPIDGRSEDIFDRAPFAEQIAGIIAGRSEKSSLVIGLYGPWGDGKTSTLTMIREALEVDPDIIAMDYNPWFYGDTTEQLTRSFFASIREKLEKSGYFNRENIGAVMEGLGGIPYAGDSFKRIGQALSSEALADARDKLGEILRRHGKKVVIFVDDIDRLDRGDIQTLFKLVRLSGGFDHTTYILAFDDAVVAEALGQAYGSGDSLAGRRFLEKIVQVPLHLPPVRPEKLRDLMFAACDRTLLANKIELKEGEGSELGNALSEGFSFALKTPRQVKLLDNAVTFAVPLLKGEVRVVDQIQIEALRIFYPEIYEAVRKNPDCLLRERDGDDEAKSPVETAIEALQATAGEKKAVRDLLVGLFPRFGTMGYGSDWEAPWTADKRICSRDYFPRYFGYAVPQGDVSDHLVDELIARAEAGDVGAARVLVADAFTLGSAELLVRRLRSREEQLPLAAAHPLIRAIAANAADIPIGRDLMLGDFALAQAATFVARLSGRATPEEQDIWLTSAIEETDSFLFAVHVIGRARARAKRPNDRASLPPERVEPLAAVLLGRVRSEAAKGDIFECVGERLGRVVNAIHAGGSHETRLGIRQLLGEILAEKSASAIQFIKAFANRSQGGDGVTRIADLDRDTYDVLAVIFDTDLLYDQLRASFGSELDKAEWYDAEDYTGDDDRRIAQQFAYLHRRKDEEPPEEQREGPDKE